jgi:hypothetical protein
MARRNVASFPTIPAEQGTSTMTQAEQFRNRLWAVFRFLEIANVEAIRAKQQLRLIAETDPQEGGDVCLLPCRFHIDGHEFGALVTEPQRDKILMTMINGTAEDVLNLISQNFLENHLYLAVNLINPILVWALTNTDQAPTLPARARAFGELAPGVQPVGACKFPNGQCQENCGAPLCKTLGGTPCGSCTE